jgi:hypothetical protein
MKPRSASRLAILPNTTHVTLMQRMPVIVPMVNDFLDAKPEKQEGSRTACNERGLASLPGASVRTSLIARFS